MSFRNYWTNLTRPTKWAIISILVVLFLIVAFLGLWGRERDVKETKVTEETTESTVSSPYNNQSLLSGTWFASDSRILTLRSDGSFQMSNSLGEKEGKFTVNDQLTEVVLAPDDGQEVHLDIVMVNDQMVLEEYAGMKFYSSKEQIEQSVEEEKQIKEDMKRLEEQKVNDILTNGQWIDESDMGVTTLSFTNDTFTVEYIPKDKGTSKPSKEVHTYKITKVSQHQEDLSYGIEIIDHYNDSDWNNSFQLSEVDNRYELVASSMSYSKIFYKKTSDVSLTQNGLTQDQVEEEEIEKTTTTDSDGNVITNEEKVIEESEGW